MIKDLIAYLENFTSEQRKTVLDTILQHRTRYITLALEDVFLSQNASAILRTCDCFGIQDVHIIENRNEYSINPLITKGSDKWLSLCRHTSNGSATECTIKHLKQEGYRIIATSPHSNDTTLSEVDLTKGKIALFFGNEHDGLTPEVITHADEYLKIPMFGFTESLNISVSAAIILQTLTTSLRNSPIHWQLNETEKDQLKLDWLRKSIKASQLIEREFRLKQTR